MLPLSSLTLHQTAYIDIVVTTMGPGFQVLFNYTSHVCHLHHVALCYWVARSLKLSLANLLFLPTDSSVDGSRTRSVGISQKLLQHRTRSVGISQDLLWHGTRSVGISQDLLRYGTRSVGISQDLLWHWTRSVGISQDLLRYGTRSVGISQDLLRYGTRSIGISQDLLWHWTRSVGISQDLLRYGTRSVGISQDLLRYGTRSVGISQDLLRHIMDQVYKGCPKLDQDPLAIVEYLCNLYSDLRHFRQRLSLISIKGKSQLY
jgi:hypothetical protein